MHRVKCFLMDFFFFIFLRRQDLCGTKCTHNGVAFNRLDLSSAFNGFLETQSFVFEFWNNWHGMWFAHWATL